MQTPDPQLRLPLGVPAKAVRRPLPEPAPDQSGIYRVLSPFAAATKWGEKPQTVKVGTLITIRKANAGSHLRRGCSNEIMPLYGMFDEADDFLGLALPHIFACLERNPNDPSSLNS